MSSTPALWHFTCEHGHAAIGRHGVLLPNAHPWLTEPLIWLTTEQWPDRFASGLTSERLTCDRMRYRYRVTDSEHAEPWLGSRYRHDARRAVIADLESYGDPEHWWVSSHPLPARLA